MNLITELVKYFSKRARDQRTEVFRNTFDLDENIKNFGFRFGKWL